MHELAEAAPRLRPPPPVLLVELFATTTAQSQLQGDLPIGVIQLTPPMYLLTTGPSSFVTVATRPVANEILLKAYVEQSAALKEGLHRSNLLPTQHDESAHARQA